MTIMGDGTVALILDVPGLAALIAAQNAKAAATQSLQSLLVFETPDKGRMAVELKHVARLEEVDKTRVEWLGGYPVLQYRRMHYQRRGT